MIRHIDIPAPDAIDSTAGRRKWTRLMRSLDERQAERGHAYVNQEEARFLNGWNLRQPGHTRYPYSVPNEDLSDEAQGVTP